MISHAEAYVFAGRSRKQDYERKLRIKTYFLILRYIWVVIGNIFDIDGQSSKSKALRAREPVRMTAGPGRQPGLPSFQHKKRNATGEKAPQFLAGEFLAPLLMILLIFRDLILPGYFDRYRSKAAANGVAFSEKSLSRGDCSVHSLIVATGR